MYGPAIHRVHEQSSGYCQDGPQVGQNRCGRPTAPSARRQRTPGGGRVDHAHDSQCKHQRCGYNDCRESRGHDQE